MQYRRMGLGVVCVVAVGILLYRVFDRPMRYEIPGDYKGWLLVRFEDPACSPLRNQGPFRVVFVPSSGRVCTSSHAPDHWTYYKFEYLYPNGNRKSLRWNHHGNSGIQVWKIGYRLEDKVEEIFVGDEEAMNHSGPPPDQDNIQSQ
jgi:hypothetical protein